jgi:hypothetical protein
MSSLRSLAWRELIAVSTLQTNSLCRIDIDRKDSNLIQDRLQHIITDLQSLERHAGRAITPNG